MSESGEPLADYHTVDDVCRKFGIDRSTLRRLISRGEFPRGRKIAGKLQWSDDDLAHYVALADRWHPDPDQLVPEGRPRKKRKKAPPEGQSEKNS